MSRYFEITGGMPTPLVISALEMYFSQEGGGGRVGFAPASSQRNIAMVDHTAVANLFRAHLQRARVRFTESGQAPQGVHVAVVQVPTWEEAMREAVMAEFDRMILRAVFGSRRRKRRGRR